MEAETAKAPLDGGASMGPERKSGLQSRFNFESPSLKQRFRDILGILVAAGPLPQTGRADVLVGG
jgi:hypothetical protein